MGAVGAGRRAQGGGGTRCEEGEADRGPGGEARVPGAEGCDEEALGAPERRQLDHRVLGAERRARQGIALVEVLGFLLLVHRVADGGREPEQVVALGLGAPELLVVEPQEHAHADRVERARGRRDRPPAADPCGVVDRSGESARLVHVGREQAPAVARRERVAPARQGRRETTHLVVEDRAQREVARRRPALDAGRVDARTFLGDADLDAGRARRQDLARFLPDQRVAKAVARAVDPAVAGLERRGRRGWPVRSAGNPGAGGDERGERCDGRGGEQAPASGIVRGGHLPVLRRSRAMIACRRRRLSARRPRARSRRPMRCRRLRASRLPRGASCGPAARARSRRASSHPCRAGASSS